MSAWRVFRKLPAIRASQQVDRRREVVSPPPGTFEECLPRCRRTSQRRVEEILYSVPAFLVHVTASWL
jgi:hypothetical protein